MKKLTTEEFIELAKEKHGDRYDYKLTEYINSETKVKIICFKHGIFEQTPNSHLRIRKNGKPSGCNKCAQEIRVNGMIKSVSKEPDKEWLYQKYIIENLNQDEIADMLKCTRSAITKYLKKYDIIKNVNFINKKRKETSINKYGVENISQDNDIKQKKKKTCIENYGVEAPLQSSFIKEKIKNTCMKKYGVSSVFKNKKIKETAQKTYFKKTGFNNPRQNPEVAEKIKKTLLKKTGYEYPLKNPDTIKKLSDTYFNKTGFKNPTQNPEVKNKIRDTNIKKEIFTPLYGQLKIDWAKQYNIPVASFNKYINSNPDLSKQELINFSKNYEKYISNIERIIKSQFNIDKFDKYLHKELNYRPDFKLTNDIVLNVDGLYWHSELNKDKYYHFDMRKNYEKVGLRILQFRENEIYSKLDIIKSIINNVLGQTQFKIGARKTKIKIIDNKEAKQFLNQNHMKSYKSAKHLGLYYNDELISLMSYKLGKSNSEQFIKIERFCSKINTNVIGGFSKLLKVIQNEYSEKHPIHYWVDLRYGTGDFLLNHDFKLEKETLGWEWTDFKNTYNRLKCRANMDERKLSEKEYAAELKWYKIYDAGQRLYIKK